VGPRTGQEDVERRKILPLPGLELRPLSRPARSQWYITGAALDRPDAEHNFVTTLLTRGLTQHCGVKILSAKTATFHPSGTPHKGIVYE
jgi:hypothetical protein